MSLTEVQIQGVRNINNIKFQPSSGLNIIVGPNGSGKTSILEALYILSRARSFRTQNINKVISYNKNHLVAFAELTFSGHTNKIAIQKKQTETLIKINGKSEKKSSELSRLFHTHLIRPESQTLLENSAAARRSFIDLGVFHVKHSFLDVSKTHNHLIKQRNKLLKTKSLDTLSVWSNKLAEYGTMVSNERSSYVSLFERELQIIAAKFLGEVELAVRYLKGWDKNTGLQDALSKSLGKDVQHGYTTVGANRADIKILVNKKRAEDYLSRGQMKLLVIALYLTQIKLMSQETNKSLCVLLDDVAAELDRDNFRQVMLFLLELNIQVFVTTTYKDVFAEFIGEGNTKVFHVKHGAIEKEES